METLMRRIKSILKYAVDNCNYYSKLNIDNEITIDKFPVLRRKELIKNKNDLLSKKYIDTKEQLLLTFSSGTSGIPVEVLWHNSCYLRSIRPLWERRRKYYGITPLSRKIEFTLISEDSINNNLQYSINSNGDLLSIAVKSINSINSMETICKLFADFNPDWIYIQPSTLIRIVNYYRDNCYTPPKTIKYIECIGEVLQDSFKKEASIFFSAPVVNMYGSEEMNCIAYECPFHSLHVLSENVYAECYHDGDCYSSGRGEIVLTNINNYTMPLIRYLQGDIVELSEEKLCKCGYRDKMIRTIEGRVRNQCRLPSNIIINSIILGDCVRIVNKKLHDIIKEYSFKYDKKKKTLYTSIFVKDDDLSWKKQIKNALQQEYEKNGIDEIEYKYDIKKYNYFLEVGKKNNILEII